MTSLQQSLKQLDEACQSNATPAALDACAAHAEAAIASVPHDIPRSLRRDMKAHLTSLWASFSKLPDTVPSELKARLREVSSRALVAVLGSSPTAPLQAELGRVWLKTSREWLCARNPQRAVTCVDVALSHADTACKGGAAAATLRSDCLLANVEARWRADMDPLQYARSLGDALWQICEDGEKMAHFLFHIALEAHRGARHEECIDMLSLAQHCPALSPPAQARMLHLQAESHLCLQHMQSALKAVTAALATHPTCVGKYLLCKCKLRVGSFTEAMVLLEALWNETAVHTLEPEPVYAPFRLAMMRISLGNADYARLMMLRLAEWQHPLKAQFMHTLVQHAASHGHRFSWRKMNSRQGSPPALMWTTS